MKKTHFIILLLLLTYSFGQAQNLSEYVKEGLAANEALKQQNFTLAKSYQALREAKGVFYPTFSLLSDYDFASGGRKIDIPLGDLFNPVYSTLNQLTSSGKFPVIQNQAFTLNPNNFLDTRLLTTLQLVNAELRYNYKIKKEAITQQQAEVNVYKRGLVKSIKEAYYNLTLAYKQRTVYTNAGKLLNQNLRYTESLVKNGKSLKGNLLRIQSDLNTNTAKLAEAENNIKVAQAYLNFLLNRTPEQKINVDTSFYLSADTLIKIPDTNDLINRREEIQSLKSGIRQTELAVRARKAFYLPTLTTYANVGYQGTAFHFGPDQRYVQGGISLRWNIFNGFQSSSLIKQAKLDNEILDSRLSDTEKQLNVQLISAYADVNTAKQQLLSAKATQEQSLEFYRETRNRYVQGLVLLVELTDAFTQYINSQQAYQIAQTNLLIKLATLEQVTATYPL